MLKIHFKVKNIPYTVAIISLLIGFVFSGLFIYNNVYRTMSQSNETADASQTASSSPIDLKSFKKVVENVDKKMERAEEMQIKDPFK